MCRSVSCYFSLINKNEAHKTDFLMNKIAPSPVFLEFSSPWDRKCVVQLEVGVDSARKISSALRNWAI